MKTLYILLGSLLISITTYSQSPIIDIEEYSYLTNSQENAYYKDINNFYNNFEGTWLYTNGTTSFKIVMQKELMQYTGKFYIDIIVGEYQYIENGVEKANTLSNTNQYLHGLWGSRLLKSTYRPHCGDCPADERRLRILFSDRVRDIGGTFTFKHITVGGQPALEGFLWGDGVGAYEEANPPQYTQMVVPEGTYIFIKQ